MLSRRGGQVRAATGRRDVSVLDFLMIIFTLVFFIVALLYIQACERLR